LIENSYEVDSDLYQIFEFLVLTESFDFLFEELFQICKKSFNSEDIFVLYIEIFFRVRKIKRI